MARDQASRRANGRFAEAGRWGHEILAYRGKGTDDAHPSVSSAMQLLGRAYWGLDSLPAAERWLLASLELRRTHFPTGHWAIASSQSVLGEHYVKAGRFAEAERLLVASEQALVAARGEQAPVVGDARGRLVWLYEAWGKPELAARWRATLPPAR